MVATVEKYIENNWRNDAGSQNIWRAWANGQANSIARQLDDRTEFVRSLSTVKPDDNTPSEYDQWEELAFDAFRDHDSDAKTEEFKQIVLDDLARRRWDPDELNTQIEAENVVLHFKTLFKESGFIAAATNSIENPAIPFTGTGRESSYVAEALRRKIFELQQDPVEDQLGLKARQLFFQVVQIKSADGAFSFDANQLARQILLAGGVNVSQNKAQAELFRRDFRILHGLLASRLFLPADLRHELDNAPAGLVNGTSYTMYSTTERLLGIVAGFFQNTLVQYVTYLAACFFAGFAIGYVLGTLINLACIAVEFSANYVGAGQLFSSVPAWVSSALSISGYAVLLYIIPVAAWPYFLLGHLIQYLVRKSGYINEMTNQLDRVARFLKAPYSQCLAGRDYLSRLMNNIPHRLLVIYRYFNDTGNYLRNVRAIASNHAEYAKINALMNYYINQKTIIQGA